MSCSIVEPGTINRIVTRLLHASEKSHNYKFNNGPLYCPTMKQAQKVAEILTAVNAETNAPFTPEAGSQAPVKFVYTDSNKYHALKCVQHYIYNTLTTQNRDSELMKAVLFYRDLLTVEIVESLPEYEAAPNY